jgi:DNA topoisomerase IB
LPFSPRFSGSIPAENEIVLGAVTIRSTTSFGEEWKTSVHVVRLYGVLKNTADMKIDNSYAKFTAISLHVYSDSILSVSAANFQRTLVDASGIIRTQISTNNRSE